MSRLLSIHVAAANISRTEYSRCISRIMLTKLKYMGNPACRLCIAFFLITLIAVNASAEERIIQFNIPRQNAGDALPAFGQQADVSVVYQYDRVKHHETNPLQGEYTISHAVTILLKNSGLTGHLKKTNDLIITESSNLGEDGMNSKNVNGGLKARLFGEV
jgi:hypothetical protein